MPAWGENLLWKPGASASWGDFPARLIDGRIEPRETAPAASSPSYLTLDLGEARTSSCVALMHDSLGEQAVAVSAEVQGATDAAFTSPVTLKASSALLRSSHRRANHALCYPEASYRWLRLKLTFTGTLTLRAGEAVVSRLVVLSRPCGLGAPERLSYALNQHETMGHERRVVALAGPFRELRYRIEDASNAEKEELRTLFRSALGGARPLLYVPMCNRSASAATDAEQDCILGRLQEEESGAAARAPNRNSLDGLTLRGLTRGLL